MDIINNAYLDMNERGMYEDKYFALSNYDNIYDRTNNNNNAKAKSEIQIKLYMKMNMKCYYINIILI